MTFPHSTKPAIIGAVMGPMMMWMLHGAMTGNGVTGWALAAFLGAHVALIAVVISGAVFAARLSPRAKAFIDRLHHPSLHHVAVMLASALAVSGAVPLVAHGFSSQGVV
ncbi:hypothetical protein N9741_03170 [Octadecabacter sp.]|nr:hypothetical protein [Octadecabacter sp.]